MSNCGCATIVDIRGVILYVIDSEYIPFDDIHIISLIIDGEVYPIEEIFTSKANFISYLNSTFVLSEGLNIIFDQDGEYITAETDDHNEIEVVMIYQTYMRVYQIGTPDPADPITVDVTASISNDVFALTNSFTDPELTDEVLSVHPGGANLQPLSVTGYTHNPGTGTLTFGDTIVLEDIYVYVLTKQVPA
jgi:hypothetical protein